MTAGMETALAFIHKSVPEMFTRILEGFVKMMRLGPMEWLLLTLSSIRCRLIYAKMQILSAKMSNKQMRWWTFPNTDLDLIVKVGVIKNWGIAYD